MHLLQSVKEHTDDSGLLLVANSDALVTDSFLLLAVMPLLPPVKEHSCCS